MSFRPISEFLVATATAGVDLTLTANKHIFNGASYTVHHTGMRRISGSQEVPFIRFQGDNPYVTQSCDSVLHCEVSKSGLGAIALKSDKIIVLWAEVNMPQTVISGALSSLAMVTV